jgi:hypothetical protein
MALEQALKFRHELKYLINPHQYIIIKQRLRRLLLPDRHAGPQGEYHIRSLYFDTIDNKALHEKLGGVRDREKYRIRIYNLSDRIIHLEKKIKRNDHIAKIREPLTREMAEALANGDPEPLNVPGKPLFLEMYRLMQGECLRAKTIVDYVREAYICPWGNVRITFDKNLRTGLNGTNLFDPRLPTVSAFDNRIVILEVKYDDYLPEFVRTALQGENIHRQTSSKYVVCRKLLKDNAWEDH